MSVEESIFYHLSKTNQVGQRVWKKLMSGYNVTASQGMVLNFLYDKDRVTARELGDRIKLDSATLTGILGRMERAKLIERLEHPSDRRAIVVTLTETGRSVASGTFSEIKRANKIFLQALSVDEQKELKKMLRKVRDASGRALGEI